jgi:hypothetical protein
MQELELLKIQKFMQIDLKDDDFQTYQMIIDIDNYLVTKGFYSMTSLHKEILTKDDIEGLFLSINHYKDKLI